MGNIPRRPVYFISDTDFKVGDYNIRQVTKNRSELESDWPGHAADYLYDASDTRRFFINWTNLTDTEYQELKQLEGTTVSRKIDETDYEFFREIKKDSYTLLVLPATVPLKYTLISYYLNQLGKDRDNMSASELNQIERGLWRDKSLFKDTVEDFCYATFDLRTNQILGV